MKILFSKTSETDTNLLIYNICTYKMGYDIYRRTLFMKVVVYNIYDVLHFWKFN